MKRKQTSSSSSSSSSSTSSSSSASSSSSSSSIFAVRAAAAPDTVDSARISTLNCSTSKSYGNGNIIYWMSRDQRVDDNWALLRALEVARTRGGRAALAIVFCLVPTFLGATRRAYDFMIDGLKEVEQKASANNIPFLLLRGDPTSVLPLFVAEHNVDHLVADFSPLRHCRQWREQLAQTLPKSVQFEIVDAHNVVPVAVASDKSEWAARTLRPRLGRHLPRFFTEFPPVNRLDDNQWKLPTNSIDWVALSAWLQCDNTVVAVANFRGGAIASLAALRLFTEKTIAQYEQRNDPNINVQSNLSPFLHFGQLSPQRAALAAAAVRSPHRNAVDEFLEELLVRRELSENFVYYNRDTYDSLKCAAEWAQKTLQAHASDRRDYTYSYEEWDECKTHDELWNAAQRQLKREGKLHGFMRMYWAKKVLEWSASPTVAFDIALRLNDRYSLDGRDPNGYVGVAWSICGTHDQGWRERAVFGKIRYMNRAGCERKFDVEKYIEKYKA